MDVAERLRGFENPLPRTESPGLAQLMQMRRNVFCRPIRSSDKCINSRPRAFVLGLGCAHEQSRKGRLKVRLFSAVPYGTVHVSEIYPGLAPWAKPAVPAGRDCPMDYSDLAAPGTASAPPQVMKFRTTA